MTTAVIKRNDRLPLLTATLDNDDDSVDPFTGATVRVIVRQAGATTPKINAAATFTDTAAGDVEYTWAAGDTDTVGTYDVEWQVTFPSGLTKTFPTVGYDTLVIEPDLDPATAAVLGRRIARGAAATIAVTLTDQNGNPAVASGAVTVGVARADGTTLVAAGTAATSAGGGVYTLALTAAQTATLDLLTATWTDSGDGSTATTTHEIVGGFAFSLLYARAIPDLADPADHLDHRIIEVRQEVEDEAEEIMDLAVVPRYARVTLDGDGSNELTVPHSAVRTVRSVRVYSTPTTYTSLTATELGYIDYGQGDARAGHRRVLTRWDGNVWPTGRRNIVVEYEHGLDSPPSDLADAMRLRLKTRLTRTTSGVPDKATSMSVNGATYRIGQAGAYQTGIDDVDAAYERYSRRARGDATLPASRPLNLDPQRYSLFHGGIR